MIVTSFYQGMYCKNARIIDLLVTFGKKCIILMHEYGAGTEIISKFHFWGEREKGKNYDQIWLISGTD